MKKLNLHQIFAVLTLLNCICFLISYIICMNLYVEVKTLVCICSVFLFGIIFNYTVFYFSYEKYKNNSKSNKNNCKIYIIDFKSKKIPNF